MILRYFFAVTGFLMSAVLAFLCYYAIVESQDRKWAVVYGLLTVILLFRSVWNLIQANRMRTADPGDGISDDDRDL